MNLTKRDKELFTKLHSYGLLTTKQVAELSFTGIAKTTTLRRLRLLEANEYLKRIHIFSFGSLAWALTDKASRMVSDLPTKKTFRRDLLEHELKLVELRLKLEGSGVAGSWVAEHEIRHKVFTANKLRLAKHMVIPDGIMGVESSTGLKESVAVELELNFKNSKRYEDLFFDYRFRKSLGYLWYVVENPTIGKQAQSIWVTHNESNIGPKFYWSTLEDVMNDPASGKLYGKKIAIPLREIWKTETHTSSAQTTAHSVSTLGI